MCVAAAYGIRHDNGSLWISSNGNGFGPFPGLENLIMGK